MTLAYPMRRTFCQKAIVGGTRWVWGTLGRDRAGAPASMVMTAKRAAVVAHQECLPHQHDWRRFGAGSRLWLCLGERDARWEHRR